MARGACTSKTCTASCGCPTGSAAAAAELVLDEFTVHSTVEAAVLLSPPRHSDLGLTTDRSPELATPTPSSKAPAQTRGLVAALLREREELPEVQPFGPEEIDYKSKNTFAPFQDNPTEDKMYLIDLIHIDGTPEQIAKIRAICVKHIKLFNNKLGPEPARIPPFGLPVRDPEWKVFRNRVAPRPTSIRKQIEIRKQVETMLEQGIIVKSEASYYSQVTLASKPYGLTAGPRTGGEVKEGGGREAWANGGKRRESVE